MNDHSNSQLDALYALIDKMPVAMLTTTQADGLLTSRPMATQSRGPFADIWFVTDVESDKIDEINDHPQVNVAYYSESTREWVSVSGTAKIVQDRNKIRELYATDWKLWFGDQGGDRDGGPEDPRLALIFVDAQKVTYLKSKYSKPRVLFELARSYLTGQKPDIAEEVTLRDDA